MALTQLSPPFPIFTDRTGRPLDGGYLYFGEVDQDPETAPITVYFDSDLTQPAVQPLRTSAGYVMRDNAPALLYADGKFSVTVKDKQERLVIYAPSTFGLFDETGLLFAENNLSDVDDVGAALANLGVTIATKEQAEAGTDNATFMTPLRTAEAIEANSGGLLLGPFATTAGSSITATGIPTWATEVDVMFDSVSNLTSVGFLLRLGTVGGLEDTSYAAGAASINGATTATIDATDGFPIRAQGTTFTSGCLTLKKSTGNLWTQTHSLQASTARVLIGSGRKTLSGALDRLRLQGISATTFINGSFTVRCR